MGHNGQSSNGGHGGKLGNASKAANAIMNNAVTITEIPEFGLNLTTGEVEWKNTGQIKALQAEMGQTGDEAGKVEGWNKMYVNTSKSYHINHYLMTGEVEINGKKKGPWNGIITESEIKNTVKKMDKAMKPLPRSYKVTRFIEADQLGAILGINGLSDKDVGSLIKKLKTDKGTTAQLFSKNLQNASGYEHKGYTSVTYLTQHAGFGNRQIRLRGVARKGAKAIVTNNHGENEFVLGRKTRYNFTGNFEVVKTGAGIDQLVIDVYYD